MNNYLRDEINRNNRRQYVNQKLKEEVLIILKHINIDTKSIKKQIEKKLKTQNKQIKNLHS